MPFILKHDWDNACQLRHTIAGMFAKMLVGEPQLLLTKSRPYSTLYEVSCNFRSAPHWQIGFLCLVSTANCLHTKFWDKTRFETRSKHHKSLPKNQTCLILKTRSRLAQEALKTGSRRFEKVLWSPHTAKTRSRRAHDALKTLASTR